MCRYRFTVSGTTTGALGQIRVHFDRYRYRCAVSGRYRCAVSSRYRCALSGTGIGALSRYRSRCTRQAQVQVHCVSYRYRCTRQVHSVRTSKGLFGQKGLEQSVQHEYIIPTVIRQKGLTSY